jgi:hypothetical protein
MISRIPCFRVALPHGHRPIHRQPNSARKNRFTDTKNSVVQGGMALKRPEPRYLRSMNADQIEIWVAILGWLLATASVYFVVKRNFG